ncbi:MAG: hypothetical protein E7585_03270 [Ruminococcaceae bacterium]|nr:hypothetical protein [Oscillospiraceae bacterium]
MNKKAITATSVLSALAVAGTVGLVMTAMKSSPSRMAKKTSKAMDAVGHKMQNVMQAMKS